MSGYIRTDVTDEISNGTVVNAPPLDSEFDAIVTAFSSVGGHKHDGSVGEGSPITVVGPAQDLVISGNSVTPKTDNALDLGSPTYEFKNLYIDGVAYLDGLVTDLADINSGTIDGTIIGSNSPTLITGTTITGTSFVGPLSGNASTASTLAVARNINGTAFNGSVGITTATWGTPRTITVGSTGKSVNGSANVSWSLSEIGVGTLGQQAAEAVAITGGTISGVIASSFTISSGTITGITDLAIADGGTGASTAPQALINLGLTATAAEINKLAGTPAGLTSTELGYVDGVTSSIQGQLDNKQGLDGTLTALAGLKASAGGLVVQTGADTFVKRTVVGTANQVSISNGAGAAGDPTITLVIASQGEAEAGADTTKVMTSQRVRQAVDSRTGSAKVWQTVTRTVSTNYQNTTGYPLEISAIFLSGAGGTVDIDIGASTGTYVKRASQSIAVGFAGTVTITIPVGHFYRWTVPSGSVSLDTWSERSA